MRLRPRRAGAGAGIATNAAARPCCSAEKCVQFLNNFLVFETKQPKYVQMLVRAGFRREPHWAGPGGAARGRPGRLARHFCHTRPPAAPRAATSRRDLPPPSIARHRACSLDCC